MVFQKEREKKESELRVKAEFRSGTENVKDDPETYCHIRNLENYKNTWLPKKKKKKESMWIGSHCSDMGQFDQHNKNNIF